MQKIIEEYHEYYTLIDEYSEDCSTNTGGNKASTLLTGVKLEKLPTHPPQVNQLLSALSYFPAPTEIELRMLWKAESRKFECYFLARSSLFSASEVEGVADSIIREYQNLAFSYPGAEFELAESRQLNGLMRMADAYADIAEIKRRFIPMEEDEGALGMPVSITESPARCFVEGAIVEDQDVVFSAMVRLQPEGARDEIKRMTNEEDHWPGASFSASVIQSIRENSLIPLKLTHRFFEVELFLAARKRITPNLLSRFSIFDAEVVDRVEGSDIRKRFITGGLHAEPEELLVRTFTLEEATTTLALPHGNNLPGIRCGRVLVPPKYSHDEGFVIGKASIWGKLQEYRVPEESRARHLFICGASGTGKTTIMTKMTLEDLRDPRRPGIMVVAPHGDFLDRILADFPEERLADVILFDPADERCNSSLNLFESEKPEERDIVIQSIINILKKVYDPHNEGIIGPRWEEMFRNGLLTILLSSRSDVCWLDIPRLFTDTAFKKKVLKDIDDRYIREFWERAEMSSSSRDYGDTISWFSSKFSAFANDSVMRRIFSGSAGSSFSFSDVLKKGKILLVSLNRASIGDINCRLLGMILASGLERAVLARPLGAKSFHCYIDEFSQFALDSFTALFAEARKFGLTITVANQHLDQLDGRLLSSVLGNVGTIISFRVGPIDAPRLGVFYQPKFGSEDLLNLPNFEALVRVTDTEGWDAFSLVTSSAEEVDELQSIESRGRQVREEIIRKMAARQGRKINEPEVAGQGATSNCENPSQDADEACSIVDFFQEEINNMSKFLDDD